MIAIINISSNPKPTGLHEYRLQINYKLIGTFTHLREEGLSVCLIKAAKCAEEYEKKENK